MNAHNQKKSLKVESQIKKIKTKHLEVDISYRKLINIPEQNA